MNTRKLIIVGVGGFGREVHQWLQDWIATQDGWVIAGFIDDGKADHGPFDHYPPVLSTIEAYVPGADEYLVCAIAKPAIKKKVVNGLLQKGARFFTLIHPTAIVGANVVVGEGTVVCPYTVLSVDLKIGLFATINSSCTIGHDVEIDDFVTLSGHCDITGGVKLEDEVFMGSKASVLPGVRVGQGAVIGAGSVVMRTVGANQTVFGVPARRISE